MIALVVYGLLMTAIMNAVRLSTSLGRFAVFTGDKLLERHQTQVAIEEDCRNFVPPPGLHAEESAFAHDRISGAEGTEERLTFWSVIQRPFLHRGVHRVTWYVEGGSLMRSVQTGSGEGDRMVLPFFDDVKGVAFRYAALADASAAVSKWNQRRLPRYIVFDVDRASGAEVWIFQLGLVN